MNLPVCIHFGWGCPAITEAFYVHDSFNSAVLPVLMGFFSILTSGVMEAVPGLRFAFLESGSQWIPYVLHQIRRRGNQGRDPAEYFRDGRAYIACEADEDIDYLIKWIGEDALVVASDYPHSDASHEDKMAEAIMKREDLPLRVKEKILSRNPQTLYQL